MIRTIAIIGAAAALGFVIYLLFSKKQKPWDQMTEAEQKRKKALVAGGILVFLTGLLTAFFQGKEEKEKENT